MVERQGAKLLRTTVARDTHRGTPKGAYHLSIAFKFVLSPLYAGLVWTGLHAGNEI
jgi:hypothetical protein